MSQNPIADFLGGKIKKGKGNEGKKRGNGEEGKLVEEGMDRKGEQRGI